MPRLQALLECVGQSLCEKGRKALQGQWPFADVLSEVARTALDYAHRKLPGPDLRQALIDCANVEPRELERRLGELISELSQTHAVPKAELTCYLRAFPATVRQVFRRPSDPEGRTAPEQLTLYKPEDLALFLPPRLPRFTPGAKPAGLDGWTLTRLLGFGPFSEVWEAEDPDQGEDSPAAIKFVIDPEAGDKVSQSAELFRRAFDLNGLPGILPLRSVYLETDPPALELPYVYGYSLTGLMFEWRWRYDTPKPEAALKLIRRLAAILSEPHAKGFVHCDLKPANVLLHPTEGGKFTLWLSDFGWGQLSAARSLEQSRLLPRPEQQRLAGLGLDTSSYASPQQTKKEAASPTDDVHALGVLWYQLLLRSPTAAAPVGNEWVEELRPSGFTDSQARVLQACLSTRPDRRPRNAAALAEQLAAVTVAPPDPNVPDGSKLISLRNPGSAVISPAPAPRTARGKTFDAEAAAASAAALLSSVAAAPIAGGPATTSNVPARLIKNSIGMTFVRIPPGTFLMGSPDSEPGHREYESPVHEVRITKAFYLSVTPVTQAQYEAVRHGKNPSRFTRAHGGGPDHPVDSVTWDQACRFCERLARLPEEEVHRRTYRLPTEAEWEYACRAGTTTAFHCGPQLTAKDALFAASGGKYALKSTGPVAQYPPNDWGLYDMHGNIQEWVQDWFEEYYYFESPRDDPPGPSHGTLRVVRGGCWGMFASDCRSASRRGHAPDSPSDTIGFRVLLVAG